MSTPAGPERAGVPGEVVGLHAEVDEPAAALERIPPAVRRILLVEGDQLDVRAVLERDERVVRADRVTAARHHGEAEAFVALLRGVEIRGGDDDVIDASQHLRLRCGS